MPIEGTYVPSTTEWVREQVETYERTDGREADTIRGHPIIVVTCRGARTGNVRKFALIRVEHDGEYALVASMGGAPTHPDWYHNLVADPHVVIQDGAERHDHRADLVEGDERERWWERSVAVFADYADYQERTERRIPVFVARRLDG